MDSHLCSVLTKLAASAKLMGTPSILCGMSAAIALTLQTMGIDLGGVRTALTVEEAFEAFGIRPVRHDHEDDADTEDEEAPASLAEDAPPNQPLRV
jgi:rsbT antagonist protein RsbS